MGSVEFGRDEFTGRSGRCEGAGLAGRGRRPRRTARGPGKRLRARAMRSLSSFPGLLAVHRAGSAYAPASACFVFKLRAYFLPDLPDLPVILLPDLPVNYPPDLDDFPELRPYRALRDLRPCPGCAECALDVLHVHSLVHRRSLSEVSAPAGPAVRRFPDSRCGRAAWPAVRPRRALSRPERVIC